MTVKSNHAYFTTQYNLNKQWQATTLHLPKNTKPYYRVLTGGKNRRFLFASPAQTLYWGSLSYGYYGAWVLHNTVNLESSEMPISPIRSSEVEASKQHKNPLEYWATHFAKALLNSRTHFLNVGNWRIERCEPFQKNVNHSVIHYSIDSG